MFGTSGTEYSNLILGVLDAIKEQLEKLNGGPASYYLGRLDVYVSGLFSMSKFKVGDKVKLKETHTYPKDNGWYHYQHLMTTGSVATVKAVDFEKTKEGYTFTYDLTFDEDKTVDSNDNPNPSLFCRWSEDMLRSTGND